MIALAEYTRMAASPLLLPSENEIERIAQQVHTPEEIARALFDFAFICWQRGQRFERARAADTSARWWHLGSPARLVRAIRLFLAAPHLHGVTTCRSAFHRLVCRRRAAP